MPFTINIQGNDVQVEQFYREGSLGWVNSARACLEASYQPLTMPEAVEARIAAPNNSPLWQNWNDTLSMRLTGRTPPSNVSRPGGTPVDAYYHGFLPVTLDYIQTQISGKQLVNGALRISQKQFDAIAHYSNHCHKFWNAQSLVIELDRYEKWLPHRHL